MKVKMIGSHLCQDTLYALLKLKDKGVEIDFRDLSSNFPALLDYLQVRENSPLYDKVRQAGGIGIPYFELEDGTETLDLKEVLQRA